jgi:uncharacterized protein YktB (UPF0637 family)
MELLLAVSKTVEEKTKVEERAKRFEEEKVKIEHNLADIIRIQKMKMEEDKLKMKKIKKYARDKENCLHYALVVVVILISVVIALSGITRCK